MDQTNPSPPLQHIFVSYSRADSETVNAIVERLKSDGFTVWIDREAIKGGELWREAIVEAIENAYVFLLFLSLTSGDSDNVRKEVDLAEEAKKHSVPILLAPVKLPKRLRYQLAGIQWIEYYRDPEGKYAELVKVLRSRKPSPIPATRTVVLVIPGFIRASFDSAKQEQLLESIADFTRIPRADLQVTRAIDANGHVSINMPADAAYRIKTAALNNDVRLINYGIERLRLVGDRSFVLVKSGGFAPLKFGNLGRGWFIVGSALVIALLMLLNSISRPPSPSPSSTTKTPTVTITLTSTFTRIPTINTEEMLIPLSATSNPIFVLDLPSNCREGPGPDYSRSVNATLIVGEKVEILGRNVGNSWYYIYWPKENVRCWVWNELGHLENVPIIEVPTFTPVPTIPTPPPTIPPTWDPNSGI